MILCFHEVGYRKSTYTITPEKFREVIKKYPNAEIHFDDGRKGVFTYAQPILQEENRKAVIFLVPNFLKGIIPAHEKYSDFLNYIDINSELLLYNTFEIGSHSFSHVNLTTITEGKLKDELVLSKRFLEEKFNVRITKLAFPFGAVNEKINNLAKKIYEKCYSLDNPIATQRKLVIDE